MPKIEAAKVESQRTMLNNFHTVSLGCAPTPSQYFVLDRSSAIFLYGLAPLASSAVRPVGFCGIGIYVPRTSMGFESRADLEAKILLAAYYISWSRQRLFSSVEKGYPPVLGWK